MYMFTTAHRMLSTLDIHPVTPAVMFITTRFFMEPGGITDPGFRPIITNPDTAPGDLMSVITHGAGGVSA
jgi:hypothetical protein